MGRHTADDLVPDDSVSDGSAPTEVIPAVAPAVTSEDDLVDDRAVDGAVVGDVDAGGLVVWVRDCGCDRHYRLGVVDGVLVVWALAVLLVLIFT